MVTIKIKTLTLIVASLVALSLFGLIFSAVQEDGILRAVSAGVFIGMCGFALTVLVIKIFSDIGK